MSWRDLTFACFIQFISPLMIAARVLSRRAWTRKSGMLFTTTISYRGQTDYVTDGDVPMQFVQKKSTEADMEYKISSAIVSAPSQTTVPVDVEDLPV